MATFPEEWVRGRAFASSDPCLPRCVHRGQPGLEPVPMMMPLHPPHPALVPHLTFPPCVLLSGQERANSVGLSGQVATDRRRCRARPALYLALVFRVAAPTGGHLTSLLLVASRGCLLGDMGREFWPTWRHLPPTLSLAAPWELGEGTPLLSRTPGGSYRDRGAG